MAAPLAVACAVTFVWLGMVLAISFLEAPLKFHAPEVTLRIGLGIGRLVFGALNTVEAVFAATLVVCVIIAPAAAWIMTSVLVVVAILGVQLVLVRPRLGRRTDRILAGMPVPRSLRISRHAAASTVRLRRTAAIPPAPLPVIRHQKRPRGPHRRAGTTAIQCGWLVGYGAQEGTPTLAF